MKTLRRVLRSTVVAAVAAACGSTSNGEKGVLPELSDAIRSNSAKLGEFTDTGTRSVALLALDADPVLAEARDALHNFGELPNNQNLQLGFKNLASGTGHGDRAAADLEKTMHDLAHPERPAKWLRALSLALTILRGTALAGQSAPVFGK